MKSNTCRNFLLGAASAGLLFSCGSDNSSRLQDDSDSSAFSKTQEIVDLGEKNEGVKITELHEDGSYTFEAKIPGPKDKKCVVDSKEQTTKALDCKDLVQISLALATIDNSVEIDEAYLYITEKKTVSAGDSPADQLVLKTVKKVKLNALLGRLNKASPSKNHYIDQSIIEKIGNDYEAKIVFTAHQAPESNNGGGLFGQIRALSDAGIKLTIFRSK